MRSFLHPSSRSNHASVGNEQYSPVSPVAPVNEAAARSALQDIPGLRNTGSYKKEDAAIEVEDIGPLTCWPTEPRKLKETNFSSALLQFGDVILAVLPALFIGLAIAVAVLHGKPTKDNILGARVESATQLGPTLYPVIFAAVAGRTMKIIARFWVEKGAKLGNLELLMASQTVWGTFESQWLMQRLTVVGAHLLLLWTLSPIGGQASLRLLGNDVAAVWDTTKVRYLETGPGSTSKFLSAADGSLFSAIDSTYVSSLLAPENVKLASQDTWGNVKIPRIELLNTSFGNAEGWISVPPATKAEQYSSLAGLPIVGLPSNGDSIFKVESSYLSLQCSDYLERSTQDGSWEQALGVIWTGKTNRSQTNPFYDSSTRRPASFFLDTNVALNNDARIVGAITKLNASQSADPDLGLQRNVIFGNRRGVSPYSQILITNCSLATTYVESMVNCTGTRCSVTKVRPSRADHPPVHLTALEHFSVCGNFLTKFPYAAGLQSSGAASATEYFLNATDKPPYARAASDARYVDLSHISPSDLSVRLSLVFNTYFQLSLAPLAHAGGLPTNLSLYGPDVIPVRAEDRNSLSPEDQAAIILAPMRSRAVVADLVRMHQIYVCNYGWLAALVIASSVLLLVGVAGLILRHRTFAPDMMGYVASMSYENPYIGLPKGGSALDAMERARILRDVRVRIGDVRGGDGVGHVAFVGEGTKLVRRLEKGREYI
ncbi:hypothetical protein H2201_008619 [Coniosporium apollinis]|uniref:Uncharacterized protein n=1 Tax=Coniosporium apollinis TaxID=61459 RepID=A0ABQ9NKV6_9PEZI|nr:hypothetical protein H2201_008619 [Coniosporium apollinis]